MDEDDWLDEEEPEDAESEEAETEEADEDDWLDEEEPEDSEEAESEEGDRPDEEDLKKSPEEEWLDDAEEDDAEGKDLAGIVAAGMQEDSAENGPEETDRAAASEADREEAEVWLDSDVNEEEDDEEEEAVGGWRRHRGLWITLIVIAAVIVAAYVGGGVYYQDHFKPNTTISGINCSYMSEEEVKDAIQAETDKYELQLQERNDEEETLHGTDFDLHVELGNTLSDLLEEQGAFRWPASYFEGTSYDLERTMAWDEEKFTDAIDRLNCMDESQMIDPKDAEIVYDEENEKFVVQPAVYGTHIKPAVFTDVVTDAVASLADYVNLEETGCYETPSVTEESPKMVSACEQMNIMLSADITYDMIDVENIHITKDQIRNWISIGSDLEPTYDEEAIRAFIADIAAQYNTRGEPHTLHTSWDTNVTVTAGTSGWELDQEGEYEQLVADLMSGETVMREPVWAHSAVSHNTPDYGNTYVEVNLTQQHLYFYKGGTLIIDTDFVSGRMTTKRVTHEGIYYVYYKQSPAVLKGDDYETPVTYWMPFDGGEGLHDATWRGSFGGDIYKYGGSHGCVNLPYSAAEIIYNNISIGDCVFVYWEDGLTMELVNDS